MFGKLRNNNPLKKHYSDFRSLVDGGLTSKEALSKLKLKQPPAIGQENFHSLTSVWQQGNTRTFKDILRWYKKKDVVLTLGAMQKKFDFCYKKRFRIIKLRCTLPILATNCLHKSTTANFYPVTESDKDLLEKIREDMVDGPFIVFTRKAVVDENLVRESTNFCKRVVGIDASQLYPFSMCQAMPTGRHTTWGLE